MHHHLSMKVMCSTTEVLATLMKNRTQHSEVVKEAREGYVLKAKHELERRLDQLKLGSIVSLQFSFHPPLDYTRTYDTAIKMLEMHTGAEIELTASEVNNLIEDEWDWSDSFWVSNKLYSGTAQRIAATKGL